MGLWRTIFGPDRNEVWGEVAREIGADFTPSGWLQRGRIDLRRDRYIVTLDTYTVSNGKTSTTYTRMRAPFENANGFSMDIYRKSIFSGLGKLFGMQDIIIGDAFFDDAFIIKGNRPEQVIALLQDEQLRGLIERQPRIGLSIRKDDGWFFKSYPQGIDELYFRCVGVITDERMLRDLFELFAVASDKISDVDKGCNFSIGMTPR